MKNTQSKLKLIKIGKQSSTTYCFFGCADYKKNFRLEKVKMTRKYLEKSLTVLFVDQNFESKK